MRFTLESVRLAARRFVRAVHADRRSKWRFYGSFLAPVVVMFLLLVILPNIGTLLNASVQKPEEESSSAPDEQRPAEDGEPGDAALADSLRHRLAFLEARAAVATSEEIGLVLDVTDRVLWIEIRGVTLRACSLASVRISRAARQAIRSSNGPEGPVFTLTHELATIAKAPIRHVEAPRDTAEANARPPLETPVETRAPHVLLHFGDSLRVRIVPTASGPADDLAGFLLDVKERFRDLGTTTRALVDGRLPRSVAWVRLEMSPSDARAVFRALPPGARLAVEL